jgi:spermidine/putrescine-binding protein
MKIRIIPHERKRVLRVTKNKDAGILIDIDENKIKEFNQISQQFEKVNAEIDELLKSAAPAKYGELLYGIREVKKP